MNLASPASSKSCNSAAAPTGPSSAISSVCHVIDETPDNLQRLTAAYLRHLPACLERNNGRVLPGVADLLVQLGARKDVLVGLLTGNVRAGARVKLGYFGL